MALIYTLCGLCVCVLGISAQADLSGLPQSTKDMVKVLHDTCIGKIGVDEAVVNNAIAGNIADDDKLRCYAKCVMSDSGVMGPKGEITPEGFGSLLPDDLKTHLITILKECGEKIDLYDDLCARGYEVIKCFLANDLKKYIFV